MWLKKNTVEIKFWMTTKLFHLKKRSFHNDTELLPTLTFIFRQFSVDLVFEVPNKNWNKTNYKNCLVGIKIVLSWKQRNYLKCSSAENFELENTGRERCM